MERNPTSRFGLFDTAHFSTTQPSPTYDLNAFGPHPHPGGNRLFHCPAERNSLLQLPGNVVGHQLGIELGSFYFLNIYVNLFAGNVLQLISKLVNFRTLPTNDNPRAGSVNRDGYALRSPLDVDLGNTCPLKPAFYVTAEHEIFLQQIRKIIAREPP